MTTNQFHQRTTSLGGSHHRSRSQTPTNQDRATTPIASVRHEKYKIAEFKPTQNGVEILNMDLMQLAEDFDPKIM